MVAWIYSYTASTTYYAIAAWLPHRSLRQPATRQMIMLYDIIPAYLLYIIYVL